MRVLLIYDIVHDGRRTKVSEACLDYGLDRLQYSAFIGQLNKTFQEELMMRIEDILDGTPASVHLYSIDESAWKKRIIIEQGMNRAEREEERDVPLSADEPF
ncbi:MAG: CRISPR-associated endonuclease Cas2 [Chloroflexota bacterium]|nr:CRISPR-associated endonuclease Cas2 [Chloroflexota bacterium]